MSRMQWVLVAAGGSLALIAGAYIFQAIGFAPCKMCYWQRWPHFVAVGFGAIALLAGGTLVLWLGAASAATTGAIGVFHAGVEQKWWPGPASCTGGGSGLSGLSGGDLLATDVADRLVMCDEISWQLLGLSMPAWNALLSFVLVAAWILAARASAAADR